MLALYHNDMSLCAQKVRVCLAEKGLDWEDRHIVLRSGRTEREATATITFPKSPSAKGRSVRAHGIAGRGRWAAVAGAVLVLAAVLAVILAVRRRRSPPAREGSP